MASASKDLGSVKRMERNVSSISNQMDIGQAFEPKQPGKKEWKEFAENTSCHGARSLVVSGNKCVRVFWALCMIAMFIWIVIHIIGQFREFQNYTTVPDLTYNFTRPMPFPSVTFCNYNRFKKSALEKLSDQYQVSINTLWEYSALLLHNPSDLSFDDLELKASLVKLQKVFDAVEAVDGNFSAHNLLSNITLHYDDYLMQDLSDSWFQCSWNGVNYRSCDRTMFKKIYTVFGRCLMFNPPSAKNEYQQSLEGSLSGLFVTFDVKLNESSERSTTGWRGYLNTGIQVFVHQHGTFPNLFSPDIIVEAKHHATLGLSVEEQILYDGGKYRCHEGRYDSIWRYSEKVCEVNCIASVTKSVCNCYPATYVIDTVRNDAKMCESPSDFGCLWYSKTWKPMYQQIESCIEKCIMPCKTTKYPAKITTVTAQNPEIMLSVSPKDPTIQQYINENAATLEVHIDTFHLRIVEHKLKKSVLDVFGSLGGQMGLALGASLLTVFEFLQFICLFVLQRMMGKVTKN